MDNYKELAIVTDLKRYDEVDDRITDSVHNSRIIHSLLGLSSEVGELADAVKKHLMYGQELDLDNLREEAGDVLWYLAILLDCLETDFDEVMKANIAKLQKRYPEGFSEHAAKARADKAEILSQAEGDLL